MSLEIKNLQKVLKLTRAVRKATEKAIETGLDRTLNIELEKLKRDMIKLLNEQSSKITVQVGDKYQDIKANKSDLELIKHLSGEDLEKLSPTKGYNSLIENKVSVISSKRLQKALMDEMSTKAKSPMSSAVNVRIPMGESDTLESHLARGTSYFNSALIVLLDENGKARVYKNPGIDLSKYVKIVCSNTPGNSERAQQVFNRHKTGERSGNRKDSTRTPRDYADYSLLSSGVQLIRDKFIDLTPAIEMMKNGEYAEAEDHISKIVKESDAVELLQRIRDLKLGNKLSKTSEAYRNMVVLIKGLRLKKHVKKGRTYYELITSADSALKDTKDFETRLKNEIKVWKIDGRYKWAAKLIKSYLKEVDKLMG